jgi:hypothetical protein
LITGYKQKRSECKEINKSLRSACNHLKKCTKITLAQKRSCLGDSYEESNDDSTTLASEPKTEDENEELLQNDSVYEESDSEEIESEETDSEDE